MLVRSDCISRVGSSDFLLFQVHNIHFKTLPSLSWFHDCARFVVILHCGIRFLMEFGVGLQRNTIHFMSNLKVYLVGADI
jgi:hypothetical protein